MVINFIINAIIQKKDANHNQPKTKYKSKKI